MLRTLHFEQIAHTPYCPNMLPCDYSIFGRLKITLQGRMFRTHEEMQEVVTKWMNNVGGKIWSLAIYDLIPQWNKYVDHLGNYKGCPG